MAPTKEDSGGYSMGPLTQMLIGSGMQGVGRALGGLGGPEEGPKTVGFGLEDEDFYNQRQKYGVDLMMTDPRFMINQAAEGAGRLGTMATRRLEQPFSLGDPVQGIPTFGGSFLTGPVGVRQTDFGYWNPRQELTSSGVNAGDPVYSFTNRFAGLAKDAEGKSIPAAPPGFAAPGEPPDINQPGSMLTNPDMAQAEGALGMMGIKRDPNTGQFNLDQGFGNQDLFMGARGGQHRIPGSAMRPFGGGAESQRVQSDAQTAPETPPVGGPDVRRRRGSWSA